MLMVFHLLTSLRFVARPISCGDVTVCAPYSNLSRPSTRDTVSFVSSKTTRYTHSLHQTASSLCNTTTTPIENEVDTLKRSPENRLVFTHLSEDIQKHAPYLFSVLESTTDVLTAYVLHALFCTHSQRNDIIV
jgi:hypothetical protein